MCVILTGSAFAAGNENNFWRQAADLPYRVQEIYPTVFAEHIIVAGGLSPDVGENGIGVSDRVLIYNLQTQTWQDGSRLPEPRHHPMLVVVKNRLLSFGGFIRDEQGIWHNSVDVLELVPSLSSDTAILASGRWVKIAEMPKPLAETLGAVHAGKVHLVSGRTPEHAEKNSQWQDQSDVNFHYVFDPESLTWSNAGAIPTARNSACSVNVNGYLHAIAGRRVSDGNLATHEAYHFASQQWQALASLPAAQGGIACAALGDYIYVFGGEFFDNGAGVYADVWEYSLKSDSWRSVTKMLQPRHGLGALSINQQIYVIAGALQAGGNQTSSAMTVFSAHKME